jgi:hypothetical protein
MPQTTRWWNCLHFVAALGLPLVLLILLSACKKAHEERSGLGTEATSQDLDNIVAKAIRGASLAQLQKNQMIVYENNRRLAGQDATSLLGSHLATVIDRQDTDTSQITIHHAEMIRKTDSFFNLEYEDTLQVPIIKTSEIGSLMAKATHANDFETLALSRLTTPLKTTFHNLRTSEADIAAPEDAAKRANCGGLANCKLHVTYIQYDEIKWYSDSDYDRYRYDFAFTSDLPYMNGLLGVMVNGCVGMNVPVGNRRIFVRDCQFLRDFSK